MNNLPASKDKAYPVIPLVNVVMFPYLKLFIPVIRKSSISALTKAYQKDKKMFVVSQKDNTEEVSIKNIHNFGVLCEVREVIKRAYGIEVLLEGKSRNKIKKITQQVPHIEVSLLSPAESKIDEDHDIEAMRRLLVKSFKKYLLLRSELADEHDSKYESESLDYPKKTDYEVLIYHMCNICNHMGVEESQKILEENRVEKRAKLLLTSLEREIKVLTTEKKIQNRIKKQLEKNQKEYILNERLKAIQKELAGNENNDIDELKERLSASQMSQEAREKAENEIKRLSQMNNMSAESSVIRNYLEWLLALPWNKYKEVKYNLKEIAEKLDKEHHGLHKVKDKILERIAVYNRVKSPRGDIICLLGPPGVGKTSLAQSIAKAMNKEYVRIALGGVSDESEIRGHRRTYIGAMPGKIIQALKKVQYANPLILLDEIDKISRDWKGDPGDALLELLDYEQNNAFQDLYMEVGFDVSKATFIATANSMNISPPLMDRLDIISLSSYTAKEKFLIAKKHLIDKTKKINGINAKEITISDNAIKKIISDHLRESGVRNLEREIQNLFRKGLKEIVEQKKETIRINSKNLENYIGIPRYKQEKDFSNGIGKTNGLAYTDFGGEILPIEAAIMPGKGEIKATGKLGDVMKESVQIALGCLISKFHKEEIAKQNIHVHIPSGGIPKDGPSAGIAIFTTLFSIFKSLSVPGNIAMTGEITLRGKVLPIGGVKEKLLAAIREEMKTVIVPIENKKDVEEVSKEIDITPEIIYASSIEEVIKTVFPKQKL